MRASRAATRPLALYMNTLLRLSATGAAGCSRVVAVCHTRLPVTGETALIRPSEAAKQSTPCTIAARPRCSSDRVRVSRVPVRGSITSTRAYGLSLAVGSLLRLPT